MIVDPAAIAGWALRVLAAVVVGVVAGKEIRRRFVSRVDLQEQDAAVAEQDPRAKEIRRRLQPEWEKRLRRLWWKGERERLKRQRRAA